MKKSSLVMILSLVGMVGCHSGKHVEPPNFQRIADEWNQAHPRGVSYGNAAVILPKNPAKKPKKKLEAMTGDPMYPGSGWNFEMKGSHVVWLKDGGYLCEANDGSQNNSCREVEQGEIDWHAAHPEDYTRSFYKSVEKAK